MFYLINTLYALGSSHSDAKAVGEGQIMVKVLPSRVSCDHPPSKLDDQGCGRSASPGASSLNAATASESHSGSLVLADTVSQQSSESAKNSKVKKFFISFFFFSYFCLGGLM